MKMRLYTFSKSRIVKIFQKYYVIFGLILLWGLVYLLSNCLQVTKGFEARNNILTKIGSLDSNGDNQAVRLGKCNLYQTQGPKDFNNCYSSNGKPILLLWGDSFAAHLYPGLEHYLKNRNVVQYTSSACPPSSITNIGVRFGCDEINEHIKLEVLKLSPTEVMLAANWRSYPASVFSAIDETILFLQKKGVRKIYLFGQPPHFVPNLPRATYSAYLLTSKEPIKIYKGLDKTVYDIDSKLKLIALKRGVVFVSILAIFCDGKGCLTGINILNRGLVSYDEAGHLTKDSSLYLIDQLLSKKVIYE